jgi:hypothetical protein
MRDNVTAMSFTATPRSMTSTPRKRVQRAPTITRSAVHETALRVALQLAGGDRARLYFETDGSVVVGNAPRTTRQVGEIR